MSRDRHASELCRLSAEVVSVRVSGWRTAWVAAALSTVVRDYYSTITISYNFTCPAMRRAPFPYKLTRPCQLVRVTLRRLSQLAPAISRYLPPGGITLMDVQSHRISIEMAQCPTRLQRSTRQSAAGSCAATALLELYILAPAHPPERD